MKSIAILALQLQVNIFVDSAWKGVYEFCLESTAILASSLQLRVNIFVESAWNEFIQHILESIAILTLP